MPIGSNGARRSHTGKNVSLVVATPSDSSCLPGWTGAARKRRGPCHRRATELRASPLNVAYRLHDNRHMGSQRDGSRVAYPASPDSALALAIVRLTGLPVAVLFRGEPGGGRRWVAPTLHPGGRANAPLVEVAGAQLAEWEPEKQQAELRAACERAAGGSLLLDEPGRLVPSVQIELAERIDLRSRCATRFLFVSSDTEDWPLRRPLRDRLITVDLPPLSTRDADLPRLFDHYLALHSRDQGLELPWGIQQGLAYLRGYRWPAVLGDIDSFAAAAVRQRDARVAARQEVRRL